MVNDAKPQILNAHMQQLPKGFPIPALTAIELNKDRENTLDQLWLNLGIWYKKPYWNGYNPWQSRQYDVFEMSPQLKYVLTNPLLYFSSSSSWYRDMIADTLNLIKDPTHLYVQQENDFVDPHFERDTSAQLNHRQRHRLVPGEWFSGDQGGLSLRHRRGFGGARRQ